jgi:glycosyltransferase involved in cell wall biosynthesis
MNNKQKKIHIAHILPAFVYGGAEKNVVDIINRLDTNKYTSSVLVFLEDNPLKKEITNKNVKFFVIPKKGKLSLKLISDFEKKLKEIQPDIVHTHLFGGDVWGRLAAKRLKIPVVTTEQNINTDEGIVRDWTKRLLRNKTDKYISCSEAVKNDMIKRYNIDSDIIQVIRNGIDVERFVSKKEIFEEKTIKFLIVGRLVEQKGYHIALHALARIKENWTLDIVGIGPKKDELKQLVRELHIEDNVFFREPTSEVQEYFKYTDIVLIPSVWEGLGIVAMEALASGRVVISSNTGGLVESVKHGENGFLFESEDISDLQKQIEYVLTNKEQAKKIARQAGRDAKKFSIDTIVEEYAGVYSRICK